MRILAVTDMFPWPMTKGGDIRKATMIEALSRLGELDFFSLYHIEFPDLIVPSRIRLHRMGAASYPSNEISGRWRYTWPVQRGVPLWIAQRMADGRPRAMFREFVADEYDVVWFSTAMVWAWLGRPDLGPTVIDLDDLGDVKERQQLAMNRSQPLGGPVDLVRRTLTEAKMRMNAYDWGEIQRDASRQADRTVVCSAVDAARLGVGNVVVVPNTYPEPERPVGKAEASDPATILFPATFDYAPNAEGAQWLVRDLAPAIRASIPGVQIRLAGKSTPETEALSDGSAVTVTGLVASMEDELAQADMVIVPLRRASGTRLKILEAFAHRVPVVSTTLGAEGLAAVDGTHLLIADDPEAIAKACARLCGDLGLRQRLVDAAQVLYRERYTADAAREIIRDVVDDIAPRP